MSDYVYIGKIVGTHGIKGEIRILSNSEIKNQVFKPNFTIYFGTNKNPHLINTYRHHKTFEMITIDNFDSINDVLKFKNNNVYAKRDDLIINDYLLDDLLKLDVVYNGKIIGNVEDVIETGPNVLLKIKGLNDFYIPKVDEYIEKVDIKNKQIIVKNIGGLIL